VSESVLSCREAKDKKKAEGGGREKKKNKIPDDGTLYECSACKGACDTVAATKA
jgi:hypothetical protein